MWLFSVGKVTHTDKLEVIEDVVFDLADPEKEIVKLLAAKKQHSPPNRWRN